MNSYIWGKEPKKHIQKHRVYFNKLLISMCIILMTELKPHGPIIDVKSEYLVNSATQNK